MYTIYLGRHGDQDNENKPAEGWTGGVWKANAVLSATGAATAKAVAERILVGVRPSIVIASPVTRAQQTASIIAEVLNGPKQVVETNIYLGQGKSFEQWDCLSKLNELLDAPTTREMIVFNPELMFNAATLAVAVIHKTVAKLPANGSAVLISHNPICELVIATLTGALRSWRGSNGYPINIGKGDIVKIIFDDEGYFQSLEHIPAPKP